MLWIDIDMDEVEDEVRIIRSAAIVKLFLEALIVCRRVSTRMFIDWDC